MRWLLTLLLGLALSGCQGLGWSAADPAELRAHYTDQHSRFLEVEGARVHVNDRGAGEVILLLHGAFASLQSWDDWTERLVEDYRVIRIDVPPFGLSGPLPGGDYHGRSMAALIDGVLDRLGVEQVVIGGNSLGGYYAAYYAAHAPERVRALALVSPAGYPQPLPWMLRLGATPGLGAPFEWALPRPVVRLALRRLYGDPALVEEATVQRYFDLNRAAGTRRHGREVLRQMAAHADREPGWGERIGQPTLLLWGELDDWVAPALAERWLADLARAELIVYPGVGHVAHEEIPERTAADLRAFLATLPAGAAEAAERGEFAGQTR